MWVVHASTRGPVDAGWTPAAQLSSVGADAYESSPAIDDTGEAVVGWTRGDPAGPIVWTAFKPFGGAWQPAVNLSPPGSVGTDILVAIRTGGTAVAVWDENGRGRWAMRSPASGAWSASASFPTSTVQEFVVSGSGDILASWEGDGITAVEMQAGTATWGQPFSVSSQQSYPTSYAVLYDGARSTSRRSGSDGCSGTAAARPGSA